MHKNNLERDVIAFATDSICTSKPLDVGSSKLGEFSFDGDPRILFTCKMDFGNSPLFPNETLAIGRSFHCISAIGLLTYSDIPSAVTENMPVIWQF